MVMVRKFADGRVLPASIAEALRTSKPQWADRTVCPSHKPVEHYGAVPSSRSFGVVNPSDRILLMIDEAHRTQGSSASSASSDNLFEAFRMRPHCVHEPHSSQNSTAPSAR